MVQPTKLADPFILYRMLYKACTIRTAFLEKLINFISPKLTCFLNVLIYLKLLKSSEAF